MKRRNLTTPIVYLIMLGIIVLLVSGFDLSGDKVKKISYSEFIDDVRGGRIQAAEVTDLKLIGLYSDSKISMDVFPREADFYTYIPSVDILKDDMDKVTAELTGREAKDITQADYPFSLVLNPTPGPSILETMLPYILLFGGLALFYVLMTRAQGGGNNIMNFGKSRARTNMDGKNKVTFADVAGAEEEKEELREVVEFMRSPKRFTAMGARIPKGCLLVGPPGTGKTLLAKAVAGAVVFIDEIDAVGRQRGAGLGGGHDEREQTLNQLLVEMDGFAVNEGIIVLAATNRPDILDPALLRPGRFDRQITVGYPDVKGREAILAVHAKGKPLGKDVDLGVLAKRTSGMTGADLENVLNEAAILAARFKKKEITMVELEEAITRTVVGPEKRSRVVTEEDKRITAYHEAGHAIVALKMEHCDPVHEVSIIPRGQAAGYTMTMPDNDDSHISRGKILDQIAMSMGGRVAESIALDDICTGAIGDLKHASDLARRMVIEFGMSDEIGPVFLGGDSEVFIAKDWGHQRSYSEEVAAKVDKEIRRILEEQFERAKQVLLQEREALDRVVKYLIEYERITGEEFEKIFRNEPVELVSYKERKEALEKPDEEEKPEDESDDGTGDEPEQRHEGSGEDSPEDKPEKEAEQKFYRPGGFDDEDK